MKRTRRLRGLHRLPHFVLALTALALAGCGEAPTEQASKDPSASEASAQMEASSGGASTAAVQESSDGSADGSWLSSGARTALSADGTYRVAWEPIGGVIPDAEPFAIAIEIERVDGAPLAADTVVLADAEMPHHGHGMNLTPEVKRAPHVGAFVAEGMLLHMSGEWVVAIDVGEGGVSERAQWILHVD
jgi:hypothetical protein